VRQEHQGPLVAGRWRWPHVLRWDLCGSKRLEAQRRQ
jgi:hypothetical protein